MIHCYKANYPQYAVTFKDTGAVLSISSTLIRCVVRKR